MVLLFLSNKLGYFAFCLFGDLFKRIRIVVGEGRCSNVLNEQLRVKACRLFGQKFVHLSKIKCPLRNGTCFVGD